MREKAKKTLSFDASEVITRTRTANYLTVEVETDYLDEVLNEFNTDEIIQNYSDLERLYEALKEHFNED
jgi:hypothetical protein